MQNQFVTYYIAIKLKELGFNEPCLYKYNLKKSLEQPRIVQDCFEYPTIKNELTNDYVCSAPLWQQVIDWLREEYRIFAEVRYFSFDDSLYFLWINDKQVRNAGGFSIKFSKHEEAREAVILKALELIEK